MTVLEFNKVSKSYVLGAKRISMREALVKIPTQLIKRNKAQAQNQSLFWALKDVSFKVQAGESLGIIGHNGAGKSTTLKLLSKVTYPTSGIIHTKGRMAALIELGAGFHPDLSGRDNIYLNGSILGIKRDEIHRDFDEIVEFAGLEKFIDTPVKRYSSGMYVRLAFSVAAHIRAGLLLVDEVLSVGDETFQQKCIEKMRQLQANGTTIVFVSHNLWAVTSFCQRAILLQAGKIAAEGNPAEVVNTYRDQERQDLVNKTKKLLEENIVDNLDQGDVTVTRLEILNNEYATVTEIEPHEQMIIRGHYTATQAIETPMFVLQLRRADGLLCCAIPSPSEAKPFVKGEGVFEVKVGPLSLLPDMYTAQVLVTDHSKPVVYTSSYSEPFRVSGSLVDAGVGVFEPPVKWKL